MKAIWWACAVWAFMAFSACDTETDYDGDMVLKTFSVALEAPDAAWGISIDRIVRVDEELWVVCLLQESGGLGAQVITVIEDCTQVLACDLPATYYIVGKTWEWENEENYVFLDGMDQIQADLLTGTLLYLRDCVEMTDNPA